MLPPKDSILIHPEDPFAYDVLDRKSYALNLTALISTIHQPYVFGLDSPWGTGKTTFIKIWQQHLLNEGFKTLYFSAWENDSEEDPLIPFVAEMQKALLQEQNSTTKGKLKSGLKTLAKVSGLLIRKGLPIVLRLGTSGAIHITEEQLVAAGDTLAGEGVLSKAKEIAGNKDAVKAISDSMGKVGEAAVNRYLIEKEGIKKFKEALTAVADEALGENPKPLVFFIDELDRCRPTYAAELLERVKHLFNIPNIIFILAIDRIQLGHALKTLYGSESDIENYLRRFIDIPCKLPKPDTDKFCQFLANKFQLPESAKPFLDKDPDSNLLYLLQPFAALAEVMALGLRQQEQCFIEFNILMRTWPKFTLKHAPFIAFLIAEKSKDRFAYEKFCSRQITPDQFSAEFLRTSGIKAVETGQSGFELGDSHGPKALSIRPDRQGMDVG